MEPEENLDLLDLEPESEVDTLPEVSPFTAPHPKKPWLLMGLGFAIIILATWIVVTRIGSNSGTTVNIDLDSPVENTTTAPAPVADLNIPAQPVEVAPRHVEKQPQPKIEERPVEVDGTPIRVVSDRKEVTFNPDKPVKKVVAKSQQRQLETSKVNTVSAGSIYVQFGSYSTRALAQAAEKKIRANHNSLFVGKQFVILAAQVKGQTTYRLRIAFHNSKEANGFCRNAKSDGLECYVTK